MAVRTIMITAQVMTIVPKNKVGPTFRMMIVMGGWNMTYGTKNIMTTIDYSIPCQSCSCSRNMELT